MATPVGLGDDEFAAWYRLLATPGLGRSGARRLLAACGSPERALGAPHSVWRDVGGAAALQGHLSPDPEVDARLQAARAWRLGGEGRHVLVLGDPRFPPTLLEVADPPLMLYVQGDPTWLSRRAVAIVGSRSPTQQGQAHATDFARTLADAGWTVISGLALGIDAAAHEGALVSVASRTSEGGSTVAVVATGLDLVYPRRHHALAHRIAGSGALVSEFAPGTPAIARHFPQRNRLIAGLGQGTLVVEAALQSGSLITARMASEAGREVFAMPGAVNSPLARGCHALIKQGAKLVESAADVLDELSPALQGLRQRGSPKQASAHMSDSIARRGSEGLRDFEDDKAPDPVMDALGHAPSTLDALMDRTGFGAAALSARLLELELAGRVERRPGGLYQALQRG